MATPLHIRLLGEFLLVAGTTHITLAESPRLQALLAYLVLHRSAPQSRQQLAYLLWPESSDTQARGNLRTNLHRLRQVLPDADTFLRLDAQTVQWRADAPWQLDVASFEDALTRGDAAEATGDGAAARAAWEDALRLYRGALLPTCYDDWLLDERERLHRRFLTLLERLMLLREQARDYAGAIALAERLRSDDPLQESTYRHLMRLHTASGDRATALRVYHACAQLLEQELGVAPSPETQAVFERLTRLDSVPALPPASAARGGSGTAMIDRHAEWVALQAAWQRVAEHGPHLVVVAGEAGIGKTCLAEELQRWTAQQGYLTACARCYAVEDRVAYAPITAWLQSPALRATFAALPTLWRTELARLVPDLLADEPALPPPLPMTERWQQQRFQEALARAVLGDRRPRLLLLDDVQWADRETLQLLPYLLRYDAAAPLLLVTTVRSEEVGREHPVAALLAGVQQRAQLTTLALGPLGVDETAQLAAQTAGEPLAAAAAAQLHHDTEGNPLFVVESVRAGTVSGTEPLPADETALERQAAPPLAPVVQAVIGARLAQLPPAARALLDLAATIGRAFSFPVLLAASALDEVALVRELDVLLARRIVREQGVDDYDFSHEKLREVAYAELSAARRRLLHRHVAAALEAVHRDELNAPPAGAGGDARGGTAQLSALYPLLAYHWRAAGDDEKTVVYLARAGEQARYSFANQEAVSFLSEALALDAVRGAQRDRQECARWEWHLGEAYYALGDLAACGEHLGQAVAYWGYPLPQTRAGYLAGIAGQVLRQGAHRVLPAAMQAGDARRAQLLAATGAYERLARLAYFANDLPAFLFATLRSVNLGEGAGPSPELAQAYAIMCTAAGVVGRYRLAERYRRLAHEVADRLDRPSDIHILTLYDVSVGRWDNAVQALEAAMAVCEQSGDRRSWEESTGMLARVRFYQGDLACSEALAAAVVASSEERSDAHSQGYALVTRSMNLVCRGAFTDAILLLESAAAKLSGDDQQRMAALGLLAQAQLRAGDTAAAVETARAAGEVIARSPSRAVLSLPGYVGVADVYLTLWEAAHGEHEAAAYRRPAQAACAVFAAYARVIRIGSPRAWLYRGRLAWLMGRHRDARAAWGKSLSEAQRLAMPYELGLAHLELGRFAGAADRELHLARAQQIFSRIGAAYDLARAGTPAQSE